VRFYPELLIACKLPDGRFNSQGFTTLKIGEKLMLGFARVEGREIFVAKVPVTHKVSRKVKSSAGKPETIFLK
jgi:hypothetical protein